MSLIAIGDIHGCAKALEVLLEQLDIGPDQTVVTLGDYIDRGPDSRGVIQLLLELGLRCKLVPLLGNHELMLLDVLENPSRAPAWLQFGGSATVASYGSLEAIPADHLAFLRSCRPYYETESHIFLHASYEAGLPLDQQPEQVLFWEHISAYVPPPHRSGKLVVVGHTPQPHGEILDAGHLICLDTYCFGGGWLTALDINRKLVWQVDRLGNVRQ